MAPWFADAHRLPAEDALDLASGRSSGDRLVIACPILARIANFDDLDPLAQEPAVDLRFVPPGEPLPADADVVLLPGSKSTIGDLAFLRAQGWDIDILAHVTPGRTRRRPLRRLSNAGSQRERSRGTRGTGRRIRSRAWPPRC